MSSIENLFQQSQLEQAAYAWNKELNRAWPLIPVRQERKTNRRARARPAMLLPLYRRRLMGDLLCTRGWKFNFHERLPKLCGIWEWAFSGKSG